MYQSLATWLSQTKISFTLLFTYILYLNDVQNKFVNDFDCYKFTLFLSKFMYVGPGGVRALSVQTKVVHLSFFVLSFHSYSKPQKGLSKGNEILHGLLTQKK